ncbi:sporulation membrane protein YtaF [Alicyclobacillus acidiphilus]|jgi:putative sporulation protein YtaF|uniref:sporulation membrane protein YtaF n=1 Tax=Alicyclobacillus acidiphilus TaxID=182455 RepID=UPI00082B5AD8|nr:sporulation membrane protein YtaF [Alicyclobacillus acidiphilus]
MAITSLLTMLALAIAANLDNAGVGIAYGVRKIHISTLANLIVAFITGIATILSGWVGSTLSRYIHPVVANGIGAAVMFAVGLWIISEPYRSRRKRLKAARNGSVIGRILEDPAEADFDKSKTIGMLEAVILGIALAMNAFAGGFDAGVTHLNLWGTTLFVTVFSFVLLGLSAYLGRRYAAKALGDKATLIAGLLLLAIGVHQIW